MKKIYSGKYIGKEILIQNNIDYPIRLDYYRIKNEETYGVEVVKTEYRKDGVIIESEKIDEITKNEEQINIILENLSQGFVTPICMKEIVCEYFPLTIANYKKIDYNNTIKL